MLEASSAFLSKNAKELSKKYEKQFIAIYNNELIGISPNFKEILHKIRELGIDPAKVLIEYIPSKEEIVLY